MRGQVENALKLARTMTDEDIAVATLLLPCNFCGATPQQECRSTKDPKRKVPTHSTRGALFWAMWHKGYRAGRDRALAEQAEQAS